MKKLFGIILFSILGLTSVFAYGHNCEECNCIYCSLDETPVTYYTDIPNDDFFYLLSDRIMDEELFGRIMFYVMSSFEEPVNFFEYIYSGASPKEITEDGIIIILDNFIRTPENSADIDHIIAELRALSA